MRYTIDIIIPWQRKYLKDEKLICKNENLFQKSPGGGEAARRRKLLYIFHKCLNSAGGGRGARPLRISLSPKFKPLLVSKSSGAGCSKHD
jgi:hypothetical protein